MIDLLKNNPMVYNVKSQMENLARLIHLDRKLHFETCSYYFYCIQYLTACSSGGFIVFHEKTYYEWWQLREYQWLNQFSMYEYRNKLLFTNFIFDMFLTRSLWRSDISIEIRSNYLISGLHIMNLFLKVWRTPIFPLLKT